MFQNVALERIRSAALMLAVVVLSLLPSFGQTVGVTLAWDPNSEPDLGGYYCYYSEVGQAPVKVGVGLENRVTLTDLIPGRTYAFYVTAYNTAGLESEPSEVITYTIPASEAGPRATLAKAASGGFSIHVTGDEGRIYELQAKEDFGMGSQWVTIATGTAGENGALSIQDPAMNLPRRFYRLVEVELFIAQGSGSQRSSEPQIRSNSFPNCFV